MTEALLVLVIIALLVLRTIENRAAAAERARLVRMAFAETPAERIVAVREDPPVREDRSSKSDVPLKPLGI